MSPAPLKAHRSELLSDLRASGLAQAGALDEFLPPVPEHHTESRKRTKYADDYGSDQKRQKQ